MLRRFLATATPIQEKYTHLSHTEHILQRPGMYLGNASLENQTRYLVYNGTPPNLASASLAPPIHSIKLTKVTLVPALLKIFDEILINARDNYHRDPKHTTSIDVTFDRASNTFSIYNNGESLPIRLHTVHKDVYVPELVFGRLLTGSNFDDSTKSKVGGLHGYGAKLTNIMSKSFQIEVVDNKMKYVQQWTKNMSIRSEPIVSTVKSQPQNGTRVTFQPDLSRFAVDPTDSLIDHGTCAAIATRVYETAATLPSSVKMTYNGTPLSVTFPTYCQLHQDEGQLVHGQLKSDWQCAVSWSSQPRPAVSFLNGINTNRGGVHVDAIMSQLVSHLKEQAQKRTKEKVTDGDVERFISLFVDCNVVNPSFDNQAKEYVMKFQSEVPRLPASFLNRVVKETAIVDSVVQRTEEKVARSINKTTKPMYASGKQQLLDIPKLDDAEWAGDRKKQHECTLILTEGDSAKAVAMAGLSIIGREKYGVFPLRGKVLNVEEMTMSKIAENQELNALMRILGLKVGEKYPVDQTVPLRLRYGHVMIMSDQDHDGDHIKGLVLWFFQQLWPELLQRRGFFSEFKTPLVKATKQNNVREFYSAKEFAEWPQKDHHGWKIKYYKGLGTSTSEEAKVYFNNLNKHVVTFIETPEQSKKKKVIQETDAEALAKAFSKSLSDARKNWLLEFHRNPPQSTTSVVPTNSITYGDFVNTRVVEFSWHDCQRSLPHMLDGLKPSQRKVLYGCLNRKSHNEEIKVAQLSGYVSQTTAYHHSETSLHDTIVNMAQDFVGSNNVPLLVPIGQFGTRALGGQDKASARYIFTKLDPIVRLLFPATDDDLLQKKMDDGMEIEPEYYCPIIPFVLINGAHGIGTGWATSIPPYHPVAVLDRTLHLLKKGGNAPPPDLIPWWRGFKGNVVLANTSGNKLNVETYGELAPTRTAGKFMVSELPVGMWTTAFKEVLGKYVEKGFLSGFNQLQSSEKDVKFEVIVHDDHVSSTTPSDLITKLKLKNSMSPNMTLFSPSGGVQVYPDVAHVFQDFMPVRKALYVKRRQTMLDQLTRECGQLKREREMTRLVVAGTVRIAQRGKNDVMNDLIKDVPGGVSTEEVESFLHKPLVGLTMEKVTALDDKVDKKVVELNELTKATAEGLWIGELNVLRQELVKRMGDGLSPPPVVGVDQNVVVMSATKMVVPAKA